jgi:trk system potassium uptake protein TrkH
MARIMTLTARPRTARLTLSPTQTIIIGFAAIILVGAWLLTLPVSSLSGERTPFLTALFTSTSATCVAGLAVVDTADHYSTFGQVVIMGLIQLGGFGYMTSWAILGLILGWRVTLRERIVLTEAHSLYDLGGVARFMRRLILMMLAIEGVGAVILSGRWMLGMPFWRAIYLGVFHSVSAFNNAGFHLMGGFRGLTAYASDPIVCLTLAGLIIIGGIGFTVLFDIRRRQLTLHSRTVLVGTAALIGVSTLLILLLEYRNPGTLGRLPGPARVLAAFFQSVTPRTGGFATVDIGAMTEPTLMLLITLMFIGASPGGTGGGIKTTTFMTPLAVIISTIRGSPEPTLFRRRIPTFVINKAVTVALLALPFIVTMAVLLSSVENVRFLPALFEITSAFGSVGLTTGLTPHLSPWGQVIVMVSVFVGRVGLLAMAFSLSRRQQPAKIRYPEERLFVG